MDSGFGPLPGKTLRAAICALSCLLAFAELAPAVAQMPDHGNRAAYEAMDESTRVKVLIQLCQTGQQDTAEALLQAYPLTGSHAENRTLFIEGLILKANGDLKGAVAKYRKALANDPGLTLVRSELANTLVTMDETDSAKYHLNLLAGSAETEEAARGVRAFIDRIDAAKPYSFRAYASIAPSSNINSGSGHKTVYHPDADINMEIDDDTRQQAGYVVSAGVSGSYSKRLNNDFVLVAAGGIDTQVYDDLDLNWVTFSQSLELRHLMSFGYLGLGAVASESLSVDDGKIASTSYGPRLSGRLNLTANDSLAMATTYEFRDFDADGNRDGSAWMTDVSWAHTFNAATTGLLYGGVDFVDNGIDFQSYRTIAGGLQAYRELSYGISASAGFEVRRTDFDEYNPGLGLTRQDTRYIAGLTLTKRDWNLFGFAPELNYTYVRNTSNTNVYDYDSHSVDFRLTKDF